ncbi:hypothetical protein ACFQRB_00100 [Halobaculum litoreum]|uniref:Uncharacterized protein n=1 Tax=Halobaculum litoreum TaxID=3031998 RepID=A0ABD5XJL2_9EURY
MPAGSRLTVPLAVPSAAVRVRAGVDGGTTATFRWQPLADGSLVLRLDDEPRFLCDLLVRDLRVRNDLEAEATLSVAVAADGRERFARSFTLAGGAATTVPAAVPPRPATCSTSPSTARRSASTGPSVPRRPGRRPAGRARRRRHGQPDRPRPVTREYIDI